MPCEKSSQAPKSLSNLEIELIKTEILTLTAQTVKSLPAMKETQVRSLGREDPLEKERTATHCNILAWRIPRTEGPDRLLSMGSQRVGYEQLLLSMKLVE